MAKSKAGNNRRLFSLSKTLIMQSILCIIAVFLQILRFFPTAKTAALHRAAVCFSFLLSLQSKMRQRNDEVRVPDAHNKSFSAVFGYISDNKHFTTFLLTNASKSTSLESTKNKDNSLSGISPNSAFYFTWLNNTFCHREQRFRHLPQTNYPYHRKAVAPQPFDF